MHIPQNTPLYAVYLPIWTIVSELVNGRRIVSECEPHVGRVIGWTTTPVEQYPDGETPWTLYPICLDLDHGSAAEIWDWTTHTDRRDRVQLCDTEEQARKAADDWNFPMPDVTFEERTEIAERLHRSEVFRWNHVGDNYLNRHEPTDAERAAAEQVVAQAYGTATLNECEECSAPSGTDCIHSIREASALLEADGKAAMDEASAPIARFGGQRY